MQPDGYSDGRSRGRDFFLTWSGYGVAELGFRVTALALPLMAVLRFNATPSQVGLVNGLRWVPSLAMTLWAGAWIDRGRRRPVLVWASLAYALTLGFTSFLAARAWLRMEHLYAVSFFTGAFSMLFQLANVAHLPSLVGQEHLVEANSRMMAGYSAAEVAGPALAGAMVQYLPTTFVTGLNAVVFLFPAWGFSNIAQPEQPPPPAAGQRLAGREIAEGLRLVLDDWFLRPTSAFAFLYNVFCPMMETTVVLYATRTLGMSAGSFGAVVSVGSLGWLVGSLAAVRIEGRLGTGRAILYSMLLHTVGILAIPAVVPRGFAPFALAAAYFALEAGAAVANVLLMSVRQAVVPAHLLGRVSSWVRLVSGCAYSLGSPVAGCLGQVVGFRPTLVIAALGVLASCSPLWVSPVRDWRRS
ncbi:MAG: MFS transporter [Firmicutes bacterium]|jgi:predicted MFS family arabinose efflux permease|nr:MFS transporter [Bacillota bacterium]